MTGVSLVLPTFDDTGSLDFLMCQVVIFMVPPWVTTSCFLMGNRETELKPTTFPSLLLFPCFSVFPLLLTPQQYAIIIIIIYYYYYY